MTPEEIAAGLTKAQREALRSLQASSITAYKLMHLGLVHAWTWAASGWGGVITPSPLGQQVRAILAQQP